MLGGRWINQKKKFLQNDPELSIAVKFFPDIYMWEIKWKEEGKYGIRVLHSSSMEGGIEEKEEEGCGQGGFREHAWRSMGCVIFFFPKR